MQTILVPDHSSFHFRPNRSTFAMKMSDAPTELLASPDLVVDDTGPATSSLADLEVGAFATIHAVMPAEQEGDAELVMRLIEIGFVPGERVRVIAVGRPGREPLAVRLSAADSGRANLNGATFAMRRYEAQLIRVVADALPARTH